MVVANASSRSDAAAKAADARALRRCLGQFATGVTVITAQAGGQPVGVTANSFSSLSLDPPLVLWSIGRSSRSFAAFQSVSHFAVNILAADQIDVSQIFSGVEGDKFVKVPWSPGATGAPVLDGVVGYLECRAVARHDGGDHVILVGQVEHFAERAGDVLLFVQGRYGIAEDHPDLKTNPDDQVDAPEQGRETRLMTLLFRAHHSLSASFDEHRKAEGVTVAQTRVLIGLYDTPNLAPGALARKMFLGTRDGEDAVAELVGRGLVAKAPGGTLSLTAKGRSVREAIGARAAAFEAEQFADIPEDEIDAARRLLTRLADPPKTAG